MTARGMRLAARGYRQDRGFSLIEAMVASIIMLIGLLGLAGLQVVGMRANNLGKRMSQASMLAQDLAQNMEIWSYTDARLAPASTLYTDPNASAITQWWDLTNAQAPTKFGGSALGNFMYTDAPSAAGMGAYATNVNQLPTTGLNAYEGVQSPVDLSLPVGEQTIFTRYWNVYGIDLTNSGTAQGKLVQIVVRWKEPNFGYRSVTHSFFKYDPSQFNQ